MSGVVPQINGSLAQPIDVSTGKVIPSGADTAQTLAAMFAQMATANVMSFGAVGNGSPADNTAIVTAFSYLASIGGGDLYFPGNHTFLFDGINLFGGAKNIRMRGDGPTSKILCNAPVVLWGSGSSYASASAASTTNQITFDAFYSSVAVGDYAYFTGGAQNITVTAISGNTVTFSGNVNVAAGDNVCFVPPYIQDFNLIVENLYFEANVSNQDALVFHYGNNVIIRDNIFSGFSAQPIHLDRCPYHVVQNNIFKGSPNYTTGTLIITDDLWTAGNAQGPMGGPGEIIRPLFLPSMASETQGNLFIGSGNYAIQLNNAPNVNITGLTINDGAWGVTSGNPGSGILISGICQGNVIRDCFVTIIRDFVDIVPGSGSEPSYLKFINNSVDVFAGIGISCAGSGNYTDIQVSDNSFDNPMFVPATVAVSAGGSGFSVGQVLEVGTALAGSEAFPAQVTVTAVSAGAITGLNITSTGMYAVTVPPANPITLYSGGTATTASVNVTWNSQPYVAYIQNTDRVVYRNNKQFAYGGYNPAFGAVFSNCQDLQIDGNMSELILSPIELTGCTNFAYRNNTIIGTSPALTGAVPAGSYGLVINGGGSNPVSEVGLISGNNISGVNYAVFGNDNSGNNTGIIYLTVMDDNTISNVTNTSQFINGLNLTAPNVLDYVEAWNPISFQNVVTFNGSEWATSANTTPTFGKTLNVLGLVNQFNPIVTVSNATGTTLTASDLVTNTILARTNLPFAVTDITDTAANIIAAFSNTTIGVSNEILLSNYSAYAWTLSAASGVTLSGTVTIPPGMAARAIVYIDTASTVLISIVEIVSLGGAWNGSSAAISGEITAGSVAVSGVSTLSGGVTGTFQVLSPPTVTAGTWVQNTEPGPVSLCLPAILGSGGAATLYVGASAGTTVTSALGNFSNGNSANMVVSLGGLVGAGNWWIVSTSGAVTLNSASYPNTAARIL
jgi:hypothetical protein